MPATVSSSRPGLRTAAWVLLLLAVTCGLVFGAFAQIRYRWNWEGFWPNRMLFFQGWLATLGICAGAMVICLAGGFALMLGSRAPWEPVRLACRGYIAIVRATPLLVQLLIGYYVVANALRIHDSVIVGMLLLGLFEAAYLAEIFRGALESIGQSQREAARAVGFSTWQAYRYVLVPQAVRRALPGTTGELVSLVKNSSLLSVLGIEEVTQITRLINSRSYTALEGFLPLALAYLAVTLPLSWAARRLERRFAYET
ncbi:MAG: amino acid transporter rane protein [Verrucomicrobiaceae bacterium]|nr:amino acid transporter rane protein [Verrucomicrobiaceae bacterium]